MNYGEPSGYTPLKAAAREGYREAVKLFLSLGADTTGEAGTDALRYALDSNHFAVARDLVLAGVDHEFADLGAIGDVTLLQEALAAGKPVNERSEDGETALSKAAYNEHLETVRLLLQSGADPNLPVRRAAPLYWACSCGNADIAQLLLLAGEDPNAGGSGSSPLHAVAYAGSEFKGKPNVIPLLQMLLAHGADPATLDDSGKSAIDVMKTWGRLDMVRIAEQYVRPLLIPANERLLKLEVVADQLSVDTEFVINLVQTGQLAAVELQKGTIRITESALRLYIRHLPRVKSENHKGLTIPKE